MLPQTCAYILMYSRLIIIAPFLALLFSSSSVPLLAYARRRSNHDAGAPSARLARRTPKLVPETLDVGARASVGNDDGVLCQAAHDEREKGCARWLLLALIRVAGARQRERRIRQVHHPPQRGVAGQLGLEKRDNLTRASRSA